MHRWVRGITVGVGGAALVVATFGAGLSPAGADSGDDAEADADAAVWNDQFATVDIVTESQASTGDNEARSFNGNLVLIGQGADADAELLTESRDEILAWFTAEGFANWMGAGGSIDTGFNVIPGSPVVLPVLGGSATNLIQSINNTATGVARIVSGNAMATSGTTVGLTQTFADNGGAAATATATGGDADTDADATVSNDQDAHVRVSNSGSASTGGNQATTANGNAVVIGQGATAGAGASVNGNSSDGGGGGSVTGGTASNTVGSVTNTASGQSSITTGNATVSNNTNVNVTQSNTGNGGATSTATATSGDG